MESTLEPRSGPPIGWKVTQDNQPHPLALRIMLHKRDYLVGPTLQPTLSSPSTNPCGLTGSALPTPEPNGGIHQILVRRVAEE